MSVQMRSVCLAAAVATALSSPQLAAQTPAQAGVEEVVVTAQRQAYRGDVPIADTPQSISVIDVGLLEDVGLTRLQDALDLSASVARQNNFGGLWDAFAVRGFAGDENNPSGYLVNGFNAGRGFGGPRDASGIERIEVLKGPNAALYGRGEPGGSVNLVTKRPSFAAAGNVGLTYGSFGLKRADVDWNQPLGGAVAVRAVGFYEDAGSFRDTLETTRYGANPSLLWRLGDATSLTYELEVARHEIPFDRGVVAPGGVLGVLPDDRFLGEPGDGPLVAEALGHQLQLQHAFGADWTLLLGVGWRETDLQGFSTEAELAASRQRLFADGRSLSRQRRFRDYEAEHTVYRTELAGRFTTGDARHHVMLGVDYDAFDNSQFFLRSRPPVITATTTALAANDIDVFAPVYGRFPLPTPGPQTNRLDEQRAWGVYLQDHVEIGDRLHVRIGGRYDDFSQDSLNRANGIRTRFADTKFSPQAGVVFDVTGNFSLYAGYGQGFRPNSGADVAGRPFEPEESESYEVGTKFSLAGGALTGTLALFSMQKTNILTADPANAGFSIAIGEAESRGLELDLTGRLPGDFELWFSYAYVDAEASKDARDVNFGLAIRAGDRLINVPEHSASVLLSRAFRIGDSRLSLGGGVRHVGERLGETATTFELPDYTLVRLYATWEPTDRLALRAEIDNLFDEEWYPSSFSRLWVAPGAPLRGSVSLRYRF